MAGKTPYIFIAWGIGITPFRSIIKNLIDTKREETIMLFYIAAKKDEFLFQDIFSEAENIGLQTIYVENKTILETAFLKKHLPDFKPVMFYLSGPQEKVERQRENLMELGIPTSQIKTDLFTGYS